MNQKIKLWVGVGAYVLAGTCVVASPTQATETVSSETTEEITQFITQGGEDSEGGEGFTPYDPYNNQGGEGAEGGEGGEGGEGAEGAEGGEGGEGAEGAEGGEGGEGGEGAEGGEVTSNADYMTNIRLMKGHLIAGLDLYMRGEDQMAQTHLDHPAKEILTSLAPSLEEKGLYRPVDAALTNLSELAASGASQREIKKAYEEAIGVLTAAENVVPVSERQSPEFLGKVISTLIATAAAEYEIALQGDTFTDIPEYQDGRGFVATARDLLYNNAQEMVETNPETYTQLSTMVGQVSAAWPTIMPPAQPVFTAEEVVKMAEEIEALTQ